MAGGLLSIRLGLELLLFGLICIDLIDFALFSAFSNGLLDLLHNSGFPEIKFDKKVNFEDLYNQRFN